MSSSMAARLPDWLVPLAESVASVRPEDLSRFLPPSPGAGRASAVLILFGVGAQGPDVLLIQRATSGGIHSGQPAFPGGAKDPDDAGPVATAVREAQEETGLDPAGVLPFAELPALWVPVSGYVVTPVLGWWAEPTSVSPGHPDEVSAVHRVPIAELTDPDNRFRIRHPSGYIGPAFGVRDMVVWGFTGGLLDRLLRLGNWELPWDIERVVPLPEQR